MHRPFLALCAALLLTATTVSQALDDASTLFERLPGKWAPLQDGKFDCGDAQVIAFSKDRSTATFTFTKPFKNDDGQTVAAAVYKVLRVKGQSITLFLNGEKRETAGGDPIVWTLMLIQDNAYVWRQTDWGAGESTIPFIRCTGQV